MSLSAILGYRCHQTNSLILLLVGLCWYRNYHIYICGIVSICSLEYNTLLLSPSVQEKLVIAISFCNSIKKLTTISIVG